MSPQDWTRVQINFNPEKDNDILTMLDQIMESSLFTKKTDLLKYILKVVLPVLVDHPMFNLETATSYIRSIDSSSSFGSSSSTVVKEDAPNWTEY